MRLEALPTPALVLDRQILSANTRRMTGRMRALGVRLRPHMNTTKSAEVARLAIDGNFGGVTVSTLREAEYFFEHGITDIIYAVGIIPGKLSAVASLMSRGADLKIITDNAAVAWAIAASGIAYKVLIEIDTGDSRGGVDPDSEALLAIGHAVESTGTASVEGVLTHAGHSYECRDAESFSNVAEDERSGAVKAAERLRAAGFSCRMVSTGSSPTATFVRDAAGVTEMRPGVYMFNDLFQAGIGVCGLQDIAVSVLASVIGHRPADNLMLIDAGALALSKDRSTAALEVDYGYGLVSADGLPSNGLYVKAVNQEHGFVTSAQAVPFDALPIGSKVRVLPNHACMTAAAYDDYHVIDGDQEVVAVWGRCNGW